MRALAGRDVGVKHTHDELGHRLAALRADFAALGTRAAGAAVALVATLPPPITLLDELTAARAAFADLRTAMLEHAGTLSLNMDSAGLATLRDLEPVLAAIAAAEERRLRLAAWEEARDEALGVLGRVMALIHREEKRFPPLADCQNRARDLHAALSGPVPDDLERETNALPDRTRPYVELLALIEGWNVVDDGRCAALQDAITQSFSRPLGLAALRGKLGREGALPPPAPEPPQRGRAPAIPAAELVRPAAPVAAAADVPVVPVAPIMPRSVPPAVSDAPQPAGGMVMGGGPGVVRAGAGPAAAGVGAPGGGGLAGRVGSPIAAASGSVIVELRLSGDQVSVETPEARREREELLEQLAQDTARWWIAARDGWNALRERGLGVADATRDYLKRFPHLLSVPLQKSAEHAGGQLAEGYALLLAHIEKQEEGFVQEALTRLNPQFTTRAEDQSYPLGQELYLYIVAEGRLYKTYPDFVREVILHSVPEPGPWVQGGILESDDETRLFMRSQTPGTTDEQTRALTDARERLGPHVFSATLGPLTTRFFTLRLTGRILADPPDVEIKLRNNDAPSDHAWLVTLPAPGTAQPFAPRKHRTGGTTLCGLGKDFGGLWLAVFNADTSNDHRYDLSITLHRKPAPPSDPETTQAAPASSKFFGRKP